MSTDNMPEVWLRGPIDEIPELVQPVAFALLQAREEIEVLMEDFPDELLWEKVAGMASPGFHLQHIAGVLDRMFTYANQKQLSAGQIEYLAEEGKPEEGITTEQLVNTFSLAVELSLRQLGRVDEGMLTEYRGVGRKNLPSTLMGLLTHAAEHTMRHTG
ncbi:DinB family protein [Mucilaginibacter jinjuensis]|uniref:DinB family protein n=1 Tax=Mucilaginibacter jinjuensis TaxID=1176721 RepID=A0ABY7T3H5_9SPHI|nr:DinB family protein [Mucilaginibacter jinjuensis]WCT10994.1 DinB family protein [Mucilaginibacter jinjuensis]